MTEFIITSDGKSLKSCVPGQHQEESPLSMKAISELSEYLNGKRQVFNIPLEPDGTPFQKLVWDEVARVPYGTTATYTDIAVRIGHPKAVRAVASAIAANPLLIFIPCHRIIRSDGGIGGYSGGIDLKKRLITLEKNNSQHQFSRQ